MIGLCKVSGVSSTRFSVDPNKSLVTGTEAEVKAAVMVPVAGDAGLPATE